MKVEVWGRVSQWVNDANFQRKGKEKEVEPSGDADEEWKILDEWLVDLADLVPLSDEVRTVFLGPLEMTVHGGYLCSLLCTLLNFPQTRP